MQGTKRGAGGRVPRRVLVLDVGGTHVKLRVNARGPIRKFESGPADDPARDGAPDPRARRSRPLRRRVRWAIRAWSRAADRRRAVQPRPGLGRLQFRHGARPPVQVINDAAMQAIGSYRGGRMLFLGLGTGLGATLIIDGVVEPTEVGHMPYKHGRTFEDYVGERGRERRGNRKWRKSVLRRDRAAALRLRSRLRRARRRQRRAAEEAARPRCAGATTPMRSAAACACGVPRRAHWCCRRGRRCAGRAGSRDGRRARCPWTWADLEQQRQGDGGLRARLLAAVVHHRWRHRQRGLLPARRPAADPRPRLHRRRRRRLLGRGQAAVAARRWSWPRPARRRCASCTATSASSWRCASCRASTATCCSSRYRSAATSRCARTCCSRRTSAALD